MHRIGIYGASGYAGLELAALVADHPGLELAFATSDSFVGKPLADFGVPSPLTLIAHADAPAVDVVLLATPPEASRELAPKLPRVIDLSNAFRMATSGSAGPRSDAGGRRGDAIEWTYGLPELNRADIARAARVANPGCYPTAAILALAPLLAAGAIERTVIVDAMSGVSGAGRKSEGAYSFVEIQGDARAYRVLRHQHEPEIAHVLEADLTFTPHLIPIARGILSTAYATLVGGDPVEILRRAYANERFVRVVDHPDEVAIAKVVGTNDCVIGAAVRGKRVVVVSAIDNLIKGAAGQAMQNLNLMLGLPEHTGLSLRRRRP